MELPRVRRPSIELLIRRFGWKDAEKIVLPIPSPGVQRESVRLWIRKWGPVIESAPFRSLD